MLRVPSYPKVLALGSAYTEDALNGDNIILQEKVDGSLFAFGVNEDNEIVMRSKSKHLTFDDYEQMFEGAVNHVESLRNLELPTDGYYYCEYLRKPKHNVLCYDRTPENHLVLFDMLHGGKWQGRETLEYYANILNIDLIPEVYRGKTTVETIKESLTLPSYLGREVIEGIVVKNYDKTIVLGSGIYPVITKYVREAFKERHDTQWKKERPKEQLSDYFKSFGCEPRWNKAIQHLRDSGELEKDPRDIGKLIVRVQQDIKEEETENIKNALLKVYEKDIMRASVRGLPEWYKDSLLESIKGE